MKIISLVMGTIVSIASFIALVYHTLWFWFINPSLTQMEVFIQKGPLIVMLAAIFALGLLSFLDAKRSKNGHRTERRN